MTSTVTGTEKRRLQASFVLLLAALGLDVASVVTGIDGLGWIAAGPVLAGWGAALWPWRGGIWRKP